MALPVRQLGIISTATNVQLKSIAVNSSGLFVAVGYDTSSIIPVYATSTNGSTWTGPIPINVITTGVYITSIAVNSLGLFVVVGRIDSNNLPVYFTFDGISTWTGPDVINNSIDGAYITSIAVNSSGPFVAVGYNDYDLPIYFTFDGTSTWTGPDLINGISTTANTINSIAVNSSGLFVAVGYNPSSLPIYATFDGYSWTTPIPINDTTVPGNMVSIAVNSSGLFVAVGYDTSSIIPVYAIFNGTSWTTGPDVIDNSIAFNMTSIAVNSSGLFVAVGYDNSNLPVYTTFDGTWTTPDLINGSTIASIHSIAVNSLGLFVAVGQNLSDYPVYATFSNKVPCFKEGTKILCQVDGNELYLPVEQMKPGTLVKTSMNGYKGVKLIGKRPLSNPGTDERIQERLYKCSPSNYPELKEDLYITGCHSILVTSLTDKQREGIIQNLKRIFVTDKKYRLIACVDERAEPWNSEGDYNVWHFALENESRVMNYGVYANGLLVETASIKCMEERAKMELQ
jgi:hypothetical protein